MKKDLAASVRARLLAVAKSQGADFNQVLVRFALERLLYRLSQSAHADRFLLKGALLFTLWYDMPHRPTRDADLLGFGPSDLESIGQTFRDIASVAVEDGITFDPATVSVEEIRKDAGYAGARVLIAGEIAKARCKTQIDIAKSCEIGDRAKSGTDHVFHFRSPENVVCPLFLRSITHYAAMKTLQDCFGCDVRLTDERLIHILQHPEMLGFEVAIAAVLESPQEVLLSRSDPSVRLFYRHYDQTPVGAKWLCVVVKYLAADAFVVTAYLTDKPKAGEILWPKP